METFLASQTKLQKLYHGLLGPPLQIFLYKSFLPAWLSVIVQVLQTNSLQTICLPSFASLYRSDKLVIVIMTIVGIKNVMTINTVIHGCCDCLGH